MRGGLGTDALFGGDGEDILINNFGNSIATGGAGSDVFHVNTYFELGEATMRVTDFATTGADADVLQITLWDNEFGGAGQPSGDIIITPDGLTGDVLVQVEHGSGTLTLARIDGGVASGFSAANVAVTIDGWEPDLQP